MMFELAQRVKLRGFVLFIVLSRWQILQSPTNAARRCPLLQDDTRGFNTARTNRSAGLPTPPSARPEVSQNYRKSLPSETFGQTSCGVGDPPQRAESDDATKSQI